jgi:hypothetical protein
MQKKTIQVDPDFIIRLAKDHTDLKHRVEHLEMHLEAEEPPKKHMPIHVILRGTLARREAQAKMEQLRLELLTLMEEYEVEWLDGFYERKQ